MKGIRKSALLIASAGTDVQSGGLNLRITGLNKIRKSDILNFLQVKYKAEVVQVVTVAGSSPAWTPVASTRYAIRLGNLASRREGYTGNNRTYGYTTPDVITTLGSTAALQREAIVGKIVDQINGDSTNHTTAVSLGTGTGFTITDDAGYYPANKNGGSGGRKGASEVFAITNADGSGWVSGNVVTTTAAVYAFGEGLRLSQDTPIIAAYTQNLISGDLEAPVDMTSGTPTYAVSGQHYDAFIITSLETASSNAIENQISHVLQEQIIFVDNGTGTAATNLTGFKAFEREMLRNLFTIVYGRNQKSVLQFFDKPFVIQGPLGAAPVTTTSLLNKFLSPDGSLNHSNIGTQTIVAPVLDATGLLIDQDDAAGDGAHYSANEQTLGVQEFIVGKEEFSLNVRVVAGDWTDTQFLCGFRKKAVFTLDYNDYTDLAAIGGGAAAGDTITTQGILNNAATVVNASADSFADAVSIDLEVRVDINGLVSCYANNKAYPVYSTGTTPLVFDAGDVMIPFFQHVNIGSGDPAVSISKFVAVPSKDWRIV